LLRGGSPCGSARPPRAKKSFPLSFPAQPCGEDPAWRPALRRRAWSVPWLGHGERGRSATHSRALKSSCPGMLPHHPPNPSRRRSSPQGGADSEGLEKIDLCRSVLGSMATGSGGARPQVCLLSSPSPISLPLVSPPIVSRHHWAMRGVE
jgi:hypothetical protein